MNAHKKSLCSLIVFISLATANANAQGRKGKHVAAAAPATQTTTETTPALPAATYELGQVVSVINTDIKFYAGDIGLVAGEELRMLNTAGETNTFITVTRVEPPFAFATVNRINIGWGTILQPLNLQRVKLVTTQAELRSMGFYLGTNTSKKVGKFGGSNYSFGLNFNNYMTNNWYAGFRLQVDSLGEGDNSIEKRRGLYMLGGGYRYSQFFGGAYLGAVDTMTISKEQRDNSPSSYDPISGAAIPSRGVLHETKFGYMLSAGYIFDIKQVTRNRKFGWSITPMVTYASPFASNPYGGDLSFSVMADLNFD